MKKYLGQIIFLFLSIYIFGSCKQKESNTVLDLFAESQSRCKKIECNINEDSLALIEGIVCDDENLIVYDYHSGSCYSLFDLHSGKHITRFGTIGQGPTEIPSPCLGDLSEKCFSVFNEQTRVVMEYNIDSLRRGKIHTSTSYLTKYNISDANFSRLIAINDSTFIGAGLYRSRFQYVLFDKNDNVLDYGIDVYNISDNAFNIYTKYLSNQGKLIMHPEKNIFAYSLNFSSNIDFFKISNNRIQLIQSLRLGDPIYHSVVEGSMFSADLTEESVIGYIDLSATSNYVYALYSDKRVYESSRKSNIVLTFDWKGNSIKKYILDTEAYYIAVDEKRQRIFTAAKNADNGWSILSYSL